jgi:hypothetical protein
MAFPTEYDGKYTRCPYCGRKLHLHKNGRLPNHNPHPTPRTEPTRPTRPRATFLPWPWPEDTREGRAQRIAHSYRQLIQDIAQGRCTDPAGDLHRLDQKWANYGIMWHFPMLPDPLSDAAEWMSAPDLSAALNRPRKDIYNWARLGHIEQRTGPDGAPEYLTSSVIDYQRKLTTRRRKRHLP